MPPAKAAAGASRAAKASGPATPAAGPGRQAGHAGRQAQARRRGTRQARGQEPGRGEDARPSAKTPAAAKTPATAKAPAAARIPAAAEKAAKAPAAATKPAPKAVAKAAPAPVRRSGPLDKFLLEQRQLLLDERATHVRQAESLKEEADALAAEMEPGESEFGEEGGEGGNLSIERELDLVLSAQAKAAVDEIDRALVKIVVGTYGLCEKCGREIPQARLKALPHAPLCVACKSGGLSRR